VRARGLLASYGGLALVTAVLLFLLVPFGPWPLRQPFDYMGDGLVHTALVKGIAEEGPVHLTRIGAPFGAEIADWPMGMWLPLGMTSLLYYATGHAGTALNLYWLLAIVLTGLSAQWALRRLGAPPGEGFVVALLYSFLPYVFYRNTSHFGTMYFLVPLVALLCLRVAGLTPGEPSRGERWVTLAACLAQGLAYVYYAFFSCALLVVAAALGWWRSRRKDLLGLAASGLLLLVIGTAIPLVPSVAYWARYGRNPALAYKQLAHADVYALKIRHLLTPIPDHPIAAFRAVAARVAQGGFPNENENTTAKLGLVGSIGFLALLATALGAAVGAHHLDDRFGPPAALTLAALLVGQVGGFGSIFNLFVTADIRGYNRIFVFIAFFSLYAAACLLARTRVLLAARRGGRWAGAALLLAVGVFGVLDQVPVRSLAAIRALGAAQFAEDEAFVKVVESRLPAGAMVFELPHGSIPLDLTAAPPRFLYDGARPYVSSASLRWSWGSINGRTGEWQLSVSKLPVAVMVRRLALAGFEGIWIDRWGYPARSRLPAADLEQALVEAAGSDLLKSSQGRYSFVLLADARRRLQAALGPEQYRAAVDEALGRALLPRWRDGCEDERVDGPEPSRWCGPRAWAILKNESPQEQRFLLSGRLRAARQGEVTVAAGEATERVGVASTPAPYAREVSIQGGSKLRLELAFQGPCEEQKAQPSRCFQAIGFEAKPIEPPGPGRR
jgi:hypothetical protein